MSVVDYELKEDDVVAFGVVGFRASPVFARTVRRSIGIRCLLSVLIWALLMLTSSMKWLAWFFLLVGPTATVLLGPKIIWLRMPGILRRQLREGRNRALLGQQCLELLEDGVKRSHPQSESKVAWPSVEKLLASTNHLGIFIAANQAFVVPRRAFSSPQAEADFRGQAETLAGQKFVETSY